MSCYHTRCAARDTRIIGQKQAEIEKYRNRREKINALSAAFSDLDGKIDDWKKECADKVAKVGGVEDAKCVTDYDSGMTSFLGSSDYSKAKNDVSDAIQKCADKVSEYEEIIRQCQSVIREREACRARDYNCSCESGQ